MQGEGNRKREIDLYASLDRKLQLLLWYQYRAMAASSSGVTSLNDVQFRTFSQNGEDGVLLYLFSILGVTNRKVVEICAGDGIECNTANLIINHGWQGLLFDGDVAKLEYGSNLYAQLADTFVRPPKLAHSWITAENVNDEIRRHGFEGEIDLLSLDIDGNDYWIWKAIDCISPRVVVLEYNASLGPHHCVTIPYDPEFRLDFSQHPYYCGASLAAFVELARRKGYRLVGCERAGFNAFFVRTDLGVDRLPEVQAAECLQHWTEHDWGDRVWVDISSGESEVVNSPLTHGQTSEQSFETMHRIPEDGQVERYQEIVSRLRSLEGKHAETHRLAKQFSAESLKREHALTALQSASESLRLENDNTDQRLQKLEERIECDKSKLGEIDDRTRRALDLVEMILNSRTWRVLTTMGGVIQRITRTSGRKP